MCEFFQSCAARYAKGKLSTRDARRLELHLEICSACAKSAEGLRGLRRARIAHSFLDPVTFNHLRLRLGEQLLADNAPPLHARNPWLFYGAVAAFAAVAVAVAVIR
ncbi:MAG: zf-HC2 domain-containing protein [Bryobacteraceae bacterium]